MAEHKTEKDSTLREQIEQIAAEYAPAIAVPDDADDYTRGMFAAAQMFYADLRRALVASAGAQGIAPHESDALREYVREREGSRRATCPSAKFGRPHQWITGAFYWPRLSPDARLYEGDEFVMCGLCGQIEEDS